MWAEMGSSAAIPEHILRGSSRSSGTSHCSQGTIPSVHGSLCPTADPERAQSKLQPLLLSQNYPICAETCWEMCTCLSQQDRLASLCPTANPEGAQSQLQSSHCNQRPILPAQGPAEGTPIWATRTVFWAQVPVWTPIQCQVESHNNLGALASQAG